LLGRQRKGPGSDRPDAKSIRLDLDTEKGCGSSGAREAAAEPERVLGAAERRAVSAER
jgi:hypothetical protein